MEMSSCEEERFLYLYTGQAEIEKKTLFFPKLLHSNSF